ncbi:MAG: hypothetical protein FWG90_08830 [Oscillospiraceae bacterium]|nr:hypothetical protein [Oscillospiraceae bacterium]
MDNHVHSENPNVTDETILAEELEDEAGSEDGGKLFSQSELDRAVAEALKRVFAVMGEFNSQSQGCKLNTGVPFAPASRSALTGVEEAFYRRNPQLSIDN